MNARDFDITIGTAADGLSGAINVSQRAFGQIHMSAGWDAAALTIQCAESENGTYGPLYLSDGTEVSITTAAGRRVAITGTVADAFATCSWIKFRSGTNALPVQQSASRALLLVAK